MSRPTLDALLDTLVREGARIIEAPLPPRMWGATSWSMSVVYLQKGMSERQALPVVAHELHHWRAEHEGHQPEAVEERIRRAVAMELIDVGDYARAERIYGPAPSKLAAELDTTVPIVEAFQRVLATTERCALIGCDDVPIVGEWAG